MKVAFKTQSTRKLKLRNNVRSISNELSKIRFITDGFDRPWLATGHEKRKENSPASDPYLPRKSSAVYIHLCENYKVR